MVLGGNLGLVCVMLKHAHIDMEIRPINHWHKWLKNSYLNCFKNCVYMHTHIHTERYAYEWHARDLSQSLVVPIKGSSLPETSRGPALHT